MKNLSVRFWMYFWMLLMVMIVPLEVQALTRDEIMANAERYKNHEWTPTEDNVCHTAKIDTPDRNTHESWGGDVGWEWEEQDDVYKTNAGIPYDWGGASMLEAFDAGVKGESCAGNINTGYGFQKSTVGVDCSGFISKVWSLKGKESTRSLPGITAKLASYNDLKRGDILSSYGSHVMLCAEDNPTTTISVYESSAHDWKVNSRIYKNLEYLRQRNYIPYTYFKNIDVELLIDSSASMEGDDSERAKTAARSVVDILDAGDKVGVVEFSEDSFVDYRLTSIDKGALGRYTRDRAKEAVNRISAQGATSIGEGLKAAKGQLDKYGLNADGEKDPLRAIILISDGRENITPFEGGPPSLVNEVLVAPDGWDDETLTVGDILPELVAAGIRVCTVGMGENSDAQLLENIARQTGCSYKFAPSPASVRKVVEELRAELKGESVMTSERYFLKPLDIAVGAFRVDSAGQTARVGIVWSGSDMDLTLVAPDGRIIDRMTADPDVEFVEGDTSESYILRAPSDGEWQARIFAWDVPAEGEEAVLTVSGESGLVLRADFERAEYRQGDRIRFTAGIEDPILDIEAAQYVRGADLRAEVLLPDGSAAGVPLLDDGEHGDGGAGDGIFGGEFADTGLEGSYGFTILAEGKTDRASDAFRREKLITSVVQKSIAPVARAGGPYEGYVGTAVVFDASGSFDPEGRPLAYRWDFDSDGIYDTDYAPEARATHIFWNGFAGSVRVEVDNGITRGQDAVSVRILGARDLKRRALERLRGLSDLGAAELEAVGAAIALIENSISDSHWRDDSRLFDDDSSAVAVFASEAEAVARLELLERGSPRLAPMLRAAGDDLVRADRILAGVIIEEKTAVAAGIVPAKKKSTYDGWLRQAEERAGAAELYASCGSRTSAIGSFKLAWLAAKRVPSPALSAVLDVTMDEAFAPAISYGYCRHGTSCRFL